MNRVAGRVLPGVAAVAALALLLVPGGSAGAEPTEDTAIQLVHWTGRGAPGEDQLLADFEALTAPEAHAAEAGIFEPDERVAVSDPMGPGWRAVAMLVVYGPAGKPQATCSGVLLSKNVALTAAHCLYRGGEYADAVGVAPGAAPGVAGLGVREATTFAVPQGWIDGPGKESGGPGIPSRYDWGLIVFEGDPFLGKVAPYPVLADAPDAFFEPGTVLTTAGYPGDKQYGTMWTTLTTAFSVNRDYLYTLLDLAAGQSGSPIFAERDGSKFIAGLVTLAGASYNVSPRFTVRTFQAMDELCVELGCTVPVYHWVSGGPPLPPIPPGTLPVRGFVPVLSRD